MAPKRILAWTALLSLAVGAFMFPNQASAQSTTFTIVINTEVTVTLTETQALNFGTIIAPLTTPSQTFRLAPDPGGPREGTTSSPSGGDGFFVSGHQLGSIDLNGPAGVSIMLTVSPPPPDVTCTAGGTGLTGTVILKEILLNPASGRGRGPCLSPSKWAARLKSITTLSARRYARTR